MLAFQRLGLGRKSAKIYPRSSLLGLPLELLLIITDFLDLSDRACLSFCNRNLLYSLGTTSWDMLRIGKGSNDQRQDFLLRLARADPRYFFCYIDSHLHAPARVRPPYLYSRPPKRGFLGFLGCANDTDDLRRLDMWEQLWCCFQTNEISPLYEFTFEHLQLAMMRHRQGARYGLSCDMLFFTEISASKDYNIRTLLSVEPRIVSDELCLRVQQRIMFERDNIAEFARFFLRICPHIGHMGLSNVPELLRCKIEHCDQQKDCSTCHRFVQCKECASEFEIDAEELGTHGGILVITKWLNLGRGDTPGDTKGRRHLATRDYDDMKAHQITEAVRDSSGTRLAFDLQEGKSQARLTEERQDYTA